MARTIHFLLALLVLTSSTGVVFNKHYCRGELRSQALFLMPESCHAEQKQKGPVCPYHAASAEGQEDNPGCCDNRSTFLKMELPQWHTYAAPSVPLAPLFFLVPPVPVYQLPTLNSLPGALTAWAFDLPPPKYGLCVWLQVFRN